MHTQTVFHFRPSSAKSASVPSTSSRTNVDNVVSICDSPEFCRVIEPGSTEPARDGLGCARAIRAAFVLEGGLGLLIYAVWHFRHLLHLIR